ncbi:hypothetical protein NE237_007330 [Protea cynaroides]|uniref:NADP-dependent oxidoreductase domain-containing protein n=1 Tax=Protea cynaroides TaxID=273540 RepID=A0A9Q0KP89_9MAGN|nr:hypothetical protein NE237_007330 [Protea cynaroides]
MIPEILLSSGQRMPLIGMGTACNPIPPNLTSTLVQAIELGYRHIDTASIYNTEDRSDIFVTSKLWCSNADHDLVLPALKETLQKLGLDYVDLYLVHWPLRLKEGNRSLPKEEDFLPFDMRGTWKAMEECCKLGFKLSQLLTYVTIPPVVNQVEMSVAWQQRKLMQFCNEKGIHVSAWSPLAAYGTQWGSTLVMENPILKDIAMAKRKTIAQMGISTRSKSNCEELQQREMKENLQIFDWELTQEELDQISQIPQKKNFSGEIFVSPNGPYKSLEELWDEEF